MPELIKGWFGAYALGGAALLGVFGVGEALGWEPASPKPLVMAPSVRQSPGGWRSWTVWPRGFRGGK